MYHNIPPALKYLSFCLVSLAGLLLLSNQPGLAQTSASREDTATSIFQSGADASAAVSTPFADLSSTSSLTVSITTTLPITPLETSPASAALLDPVSIPQSVFLPAIFFQPPVPIPPLPPEKLLFCSTFFNPRSIPDDDPNGLKDSIQISDSRQIADLDISLDISHTWVGDLIAYLRHDENGREITLLRRPGRTGSDLGCGYNDIKAILDDQISSPVDEKCASAPAAISGIYIPNQPLTTFYGESIAGSWTLTVIDRHPRDSGRLNRWCMLASIRETLEAPTPTPTPPPSPPQATLTGVTGKNQSLPLDCESRSAVDWAAYFGYHIDELEFFSRLPHSDNPDKGFVGNVYGEWGQIPPNPYGVHAEPVASLLRNYGLPAYAHRPYNWDLLKAEISAGRPVIIWIIDSVSNGIPIYYIPSDGLPTIVARYEHTVIVTGYSSNYVYYLNGDAIYHTTISQFLDSWSVLGNMAITANP